MKPYLWWNSVMFLGFLISVILGLLDSGFAIAAMFFFPPLIFFAFFAPTFFVYSALLAPLVLSIDGREPRALLAALSIVAIAIVAILPGVISRHQFRELQSRFQGDDAANPVRTAETKILRVIEPASRDGSCRGICPHLLIDGGVDSVLVPMSKGGFRSHRIWDRRHCKSPRSFGRNCLHSEYAENGDADVEIKVIDRTNERDVRKVLAPLKR